MHYFSYLSLTFLAIYLISILNIQREKEIKRKNNKEELSYQKKQI